jgi:hypothetical protein
LVYYFKLSYLLLQVYILLAQAQTLDPGFSYNLGRIPGEGGGLKYELWVIRHSANGKKIISVAL